MTGTDRKLAQGTALSVSELASMDFYAEPHGGGSVPWGRYTGAEILNKLYFGGALYSIGSVSDGQILQRSGGTVIGADVLLNPSAWTGKFYAQDAAPSSPNADDLWWETDTGIMWTYGTYAGSARWVSSQLYMTNLLNSGGAALSAGQIVMAPSQMFGYGYDIYLDTFYNRAHVLTTNDANNYWKFDIRKVSGSTPPSSGAGSLVATMNTSAKSPGAWFDISVSVDAVIDGTGSGIEFPFIETSKAGSGSAPGNIWEAMGLTFRLIHP
jgi:hypothetical protein